MFVREGDKSKEYKVTAEGSLGLLALGAAGLQAWRKARFNAGKKDNNREGTTQDEKAGE